MDQVALEQPRFNLSIAGDNDWGNHKFGGWDTKPHAPFSDDEDREKDFPLRT